MSMPVGINDPGVRRIELKSADGTVTGSITITKTSQKKQKRLQYNFKEISGRIMRARTPGNARQAAATARQKAAQLRRMRKSGLYDDKEMQSAILHAEAIARVAKKRMRHLEEEEREEQGGGFCEGGLEDNAEELIAEELEQIKKKHRSGELREIAEADMKYLKALFERLVREKQNAGSGVGSAVSENNSVFLQLGGTDIPVQASVPVDAAVTEGGTIDTKV